MNRSRSGLSSCTNSIASDQGLTLAHIFAQPGPFFFTETSKAPQHMGQKVLALS